jgi:hypothetical protein
MMITWRRKFCLACSKLCVPDSDRNGVVSPREKEGVEGIGEDEAEFKFNIFLQASSSMHCFCYI